MAVTLNKISDQGTRVFHPYFGYGNTLHTLGTHTTAVSFDALDWHTAYQGTPVMNHEITPLAPITCHHGVPTNAPHGCYYCN